MANRPDDFKGIDLTSPINRLGAGKAAMAANVRAYLSGGFKLRNLLSAPILTLDSSVQSLVRMNDTTPAGPSSGYVLISGDEAGRIYANDSSVGSGFSSNPVSIIKSRPDQSPEPWAYVGDNSEDVTITTKFALNGLPDTFNCFGQVKVRSDGLIYKTGIKEPPFAPAISTENTSVSTSGTLNAKTIPWTNYTGANANYDYGEINGYPGTDGTAPFIVDVANASTITIVALTGTANINGNAAATPTTLGPSTALSTNPGHYIQVAGTGGVPATATVVVGAFTDGAGNVIAVGVSPMYVPSVVDVGGVIGVSGAIQVPYGALAFQIGINSTGNTFNSNSGSFQITVEVTTNSLPSVTSILGTLSLYYWDDSPHSGPVASYIWKNPSDSSGGGTSRSISNAIGNTTGNSFIFDATFTNGIPALPGIGTESVPMEWTVLNPESTSTGQTPVFPSPLTTTDSSNTLYGNFNFCLFGKIYIPAPGEYTFVLTCKDDCLFGVEDATFVSSTGSTMGNNGQTISVAQGYPLIPINHESSGEAGTHSVTTVVLSFTSAGTKGIEIDYDYWYHTQRILLLMVSPTPGATPTIVPPLPSTVRTGVSYAGKYRCSITGAQSNPSPTTTPETIPVLANTVSLPYSPDPQVDKCDYYRQDEGLANYTYVATGPNTNPPTAITDSLTDLEVDGNQIMVYDDYEPVPSIDLPKSGIVNVDGGIINWVSGDQFNMRWLPGTKILIGSPTQLAYIFISRPTSPTQVLIPGVPNGANLVYNIAQPILANQPLPYMFGPTDNINFVFAVGDPLRPGTLYWCKGSNLDSWPDTNQMDVTNPSETLVNGAMSGGRGALFSIKRAWVIMPNFYNALATVTGTSGSTWTLQDTSINRGLFIPRCLCVEGGGNIFFRVNDGWHLSRNGLASQSITDEDLYPLFAHEGSTPVPIVRNGITIYPPNDSLPERQKSQIVNSYMYWDYVGLDDLPHTLVFDVAAMGWVWDLYDYPVTVRASNEGESIQGTLVGCDDGTIRQMVSTGAVESASGTVVTPAIGGAGWQSMYELTIEYASNDVVTITPIAVDVNNGSYAPNPLTLPSTGGAQTKYTTKVSPAKWKWLQFMFQSEDSTMQVNLDGFVAQTREWGSQHSYRAVQPFRPNGGHGGQP